MNFKSLHSNLNGLSFGKVGATLLFTLLLLANLGAQQEQFSQAQQLAVSGQHAEAEAILGQLAAAHPDYLPAALLRAHNFSWSGQHRRSIDAFQAILGQQPGQVDALAGLGYAYSWSGNADKAIETFQRAIEQAPDNIDARKGLGYAYLAAQDARQAILVFERLAQGHPELTEHHIALGKAQLLAGRSKAAKQSFEQALAADPSNAEAQQLLATARSQGAALELDIWGGYSKVEEDNRTGLRLLQALYRINSRYSVFAKFDNTLSLDNLDFVNRNSNASSLWGGALAGWNDRLATRLEYGMRFFPDRENQQQARLEQVFYIHNGFSARLGGWLAFSSDFPTEWYGYAGLYIPVTSFLALEPSYYYGQDGFNSVNQQRAVLAAKLLLPQGPEFTLGGFVGKADLGIEGIPDNISGGYLLALMPLNDWLSGQLAVNYEKGNFATATVVAAGLKLRFR
ncbi:MAG: tetratricopeptide repeat protein [Phaeodactylibacter sp.]|nr:tetratricopeptide repeat protein [Phaeodactylibacter sp.]MCB9051488.1 tetratricopeptide repeat protein [Lewinellaceae bacterium]